MPAALPCRDIRRATGEAKRQNPERWRRTTAPSSRGGRLIVRGHGIGRKKLMSGRRQLAQELEDLRADADAGDERDPPLHTARAP